MAEARRDCPLCNEPVPEGVLKCDNCGADVAEDSRWEGGAGQGPAKRGRAARTRSAEEPAPPEDPKTEGPESIEERVKSFLYLCPSCGEFVRAEDTSCANCGKSLGGEAPVETIVPEAEGTPGADGRTRCTECGAAMTPHQTTCGVCGAPLEAGEETPEPAVARIEAAAIAKDETLSELDGLVERVLAEDDIEPAAEPAAPVSEPGMRAQSGKEIEGRRSPRSASTREGVTRSFPDSLATRREYVAVVTGLAAPAVAAIATGAPGQAWGQLFPFSVLFGMALFAIVLNVAIPDVRSVARTPLFLLWILGTTLAIGVPLAALTGFPLIAPAGLGLLGVGGGLAILAAWRLPRSVGIFLPWVSGLLILLLTAVAPLAFVTLGDPTVASALWLAGSGLAAGPVVLIVYRRSMASRARRSLASAEGALTKREYAKALGLYDETLVLAGRAGQDLGAALYGKGAALVAVGRPDDALEVLDRALTSNPRNEVAWVNKGTALTHMGRMQDALKCYNSAIRVNAEYEVAWNNKGNALSRLGKHDWALKCYEHALTLDPSYRTAWVNKGYVLAKLGRFDEAAECADRALRLTPSAAA